jgi:hypothetical protein
MEKTKKKPILIHLDVDLYEALKLKAKSDRKSVTALIREFAVSILNHASAPKQPE